MPGKRFARIRNHFVAAAAARARAILPSLIALCLSAPAMAERQPTRNLLTDGKDCSKLAIARVRPVYPKDALQRHLVGWVVISYYLTGDGIASNITIVDSEPNYAFVDNSLEMLAKWRFQRGVAREDCRVLVRFTP
jgi:TonB family protein